MRTPATPDTALRGGEERVRNNISNKDAGDERDGGRQGSIWVEDEAQDVDQPASDDHEAGQELGPQETTAGVAGVEGPLSNTGQYPKASPQPRSARKAPAPLDRLQGGSGSDEGDAEIIAGPSKRRRTTGGKGPGALNSKAAGGGPRQHPRLPTDKGHTTEQYARYHPRERQNLQPLAALPRAVTFNLFSSYPLYMELANCDPNTLWSAPKGVRLDDYNCGQALISCSNAERSLNWPSEFDTKGMLRATRNPLGHAFKIFVRKGDVDGDGVIARHDDTGYYYAWFRGLQPLMGKEGWDDGLFRVRPSGQKEKCRKLCWFHHSKCAIQLRVGHSSDPTFGGTEKDDAAGQLALLVPQIAAATSDAVFEKLRPHMEGERSV